MIFYSNDGIFGSANYYVQQMYGNNVGKYSLPSELTGAADLTLYESAADADGDVILKIVNVSDEDIPMDVILEGRDITCFQQEAEVTVLTGADKKAMNALGKMEVVPQESKMGIGQTFAYTAPAISLTVIHLVSLKDE